MAARGALALLCIAAVVSANDNGLARTPPRGWRSWNLFGANVNQTLIERIMDGMASRKRMVNGKPTSLCDVGYCDVGLDDNWQACGDPRAAPGMHYHDADGRPIVNLERFPDLKKMTDYAHSLGLTAGWYGNNCICSDKCAGDQCNQQIQGDVAALREYNFDSWKLDACGGQHDLVAFNKYVAASGRPVMVENCHWGLVAPARPDPAKPPAEGCPWNFYRTSLDVRASYASVMFNLLTVEPLHKGNLSYPGCWAYPDMLQVGCAHGPGGAGDPGLTFAETRSHFGAWAIVSSPLTLSHDVTNDTVMNAVWDVITNTEVLEVNAAYVGDSGGRFQQSQETVALTDAHLRREGKVDVIAASATYLSKPIGGGRVAVLLMNSGKDTVELTVRFADVPNLACASCAVRDIWAREDRGAFDASYTVAVASHDAAFLVLSAA